MDTCTMYPKVILITPWGFVCTVQMLIPDQVMEDMFGIAIQLHQSCYREH